MGDAVVVEGWGGVEVVVGAGGLTLVVGCGCGWGDGAGAWVVAGGEEEPSLNDQLAWNTPAEVGANCSNRPGTTA